MEEKIIKGGLYRHFHGNYRLFRVVGTGIYDDQNGETLTDVVIYHAENKDGSIRQYWVRPKHEFLEMVQIGEGEERQRFTYIIED